MNRRRCEGTPFKYTNRVSNLGVSRGTPPLMNRRAMLANSHGKLSTMDAPSGGRKAAAKIISRTRAAPSLVTTPGSVMPPIE